MSEAWIALSGMFYGKLNLKQLLARDMFAPVYAWLNRWMFLYDELLKINQIN